VAFVFLILQRSLSFLFSRLTVLVFVFLGLMLAWFPFGFHFSGRRLFVSDSLFALILVNGFWIISRNFCLETISVFVCLL
jgi:hypothetical protein